MDGDGTARGVPGRRMRAVGEDGRPGGCGRRAGAGAWRPEGRRCRWPGRRVPAALPGRARAGSRATSSATTTLAVPDPRARTGSSEVTIVDVAADGYRLRLVDHPPAFDRAGFYGDERFGLRGQRLAVRAVRPGRARGTAGGRAPGRRAPPPRLAGRAGRHLPRPVVRGRSDRRSRGAGLDAPQPRVPRLDRECGAAPARSAAGWRGSRPERGRGRPPGGRHRGGRDREHGLPDVRARGADAGVRDGPRSTASRSAGTGSSGSSTGSTRRSGIRRPTGTSPRRTHAAISPARPVSRADLLAAHRVRSGRRRAGHRDDRAPRPAEGLRPAGRCDAGAAGPRWARWSSRATATRRWPIRSARSPRHRRGRSRSSSGSIGPWRAGSTRAPTSSRCRRGSSRAARAR